MSLLLRRLGRGLGRNVAATSAESDDPRLRGRTYAIPFEEVWQNALKLAGGELRGWRVTLADDHEGIIQATSQGTILRGISDVFITIQLDADAQTRVDVRAASRGRGADLGRNARRIGRFFRQLDARLTSAHGRAAVLRD